MLMTFWFIDKAETEKELLTNFRVREIALVDSGEAIAFVNPTKSTITLFFLNNFIVKDLVPIVKLCSQMVERTHVMKYIRVSFDRSFTFAVHIDQVFIKAGKGNLCNESNG
jgi:hypothetical protein